ncbi:methionyl-tRNA formyltransferase [Bacteroidota bacterium]
MRDLRIIFMGTPDFAVPSLQYLVDNGYEVVAVITAPDKPRGRGQQITPSPVKNYAESVEIPVLQPTNLKSPEFIEELRSYKANLQVVVAFRMLPEMVWDMPEFGTFNLHASLLPQYRGAAPINWAIINGESVTGVTTFFIRHAIDTGSIILQNEELIKPDDTAGTLHDRLMEGGGRIVLETVRLIEKEEENPTPQDMSVEIKNAPKIFKEDCEIDWNRPSEEVRNFIRGLSPYPAAWTRIDDQIFKIYEAEYGNIDCDIQPGHIETDNQTHITIGTINGTLSVKGIQAPGKKRMETVDFLRGNNL